MLFYFNEGTKCNQGNMQPEINHDNQYRQCQSPAARTETPWCFAGVLDRLEEGVLIISTALPGITYCNTAAGEILTICDINLDFDDIKTFLETKGIDLFQTDNQQQRTILHRNRILALNLTSLPDRSLFIQIKDITEQKRLESIAQTVNTMDNLGFIFSGIRHEIGNPLNSIKMTNSVLQKNLETFTRQDISRYIDRTTSEIARMEYLLKSLKNFSMYEKVDCSPHRLEKFLTTLLGLIKPDLQQKKIAIDCDLPPNHLKVSIDPRALHQATLNIITNAADALLGHPEPLISIKVELDKNEQIVWLKINDNGCGMSGEQIKMLFQPFYTNKPHGNGLGLVITRKLLTMMQASLEISSEIGQGSCVRIGLLLADDINQQVVANDNRQMFEPIKG
ncbi:MAG: hypothetical protein C0623_08165 [Desulfuromonas sp.]|nr:MAG: hypothetical protein C0623_08165 [Desulfuromonas sp.]